jgi:hypothetical protein
LQKLFPGFLAEPGQSTPRNAARAEIIAAQPQKLPPARRQPLNR